MTPVTFNGTFGWPAIKASNLPAGGPAPPIAVPGLRVKAALTDDVTVFGAVFNGNPARPGDGDPQTRGNHGLAFRVNYPPWFIGQIHFDYHLDIGGSSLAGNFTPGGWYHFGDFDSQRFTAEGVSLADPTGSGVPAKLRGNYGIYAVVEQALWRPPGGCVCNRPHITFWDFQFDCEFSADNFLRISLTKQAL